MIQVLICDTGAHNYVPMETFVTGTVKEGTLTTISKVYCTKCGAIMFLDEVQKYLQGGKHGKGT